MNKKRTIAIAQARMGSTRLPGKVMMPLGREGRPVLRWAYDAIKAAYGIDEVVIATSTLSADDNIARYCAFNNISCFRGSESDVVKRFYECALAYGAEVVLRLTCDCPFLDPNVISEVVRLQAMREVAYASNIDPPTYPDGLDVECFRFDALFAAHNEATRGSDRDCVTQYILRNRDRFPAANLTCPLPDLVKERWVLDTQEDYQFCHEVACRLTAPIPNYMDILKVLDIIPELRQLNQAGIRNERFFETIHTEELPARTFKRSQARLASASRIIPFGAQTFSKSHLQFPPGASPLYVSHADGARIFDVDGNDYVDLVNAVLPVVLGYRDPDVDRAVREQLDNGISFSLATRLEEELAEELVNLIPCAEMVKFGKSGTDVTTAAVRAARAFTGRDLVMVGGYHGWADWSMAVTDRNLGIPKDVRKHSLKCPAIGEQPWGDPNNVPAAIIIEPDGRPELLHWLRGICDQFGIVLIFDEVITGFRWSLGGAQQYYDVTPDLATFGKAMANGMPLSAVVGRRDIMKKFEPPENIFYSGTFFGETLSLAASLATIKKLQRENVIDHLWRTGDAIDTIVKHEIKSWDLEDIVKLSGEAPMRKISFNGVENATANQIKTLFMQGMIEQGVLIIASNNISFAHKAPELKRIKSAYEYSIGLIRNAIDMNCIHEMIDDEIAGVAPLRKQ